MDKTSFMGLGYAAEKLLEHYTKAPPKIDISSPDSISEFVSGAPTPFSNNQLLMAPLLGAGAGGLAGWAFGNPKARKREMLVGALGGGMIGGGAALGYKYLGGLGANKARELNTVPADVIQQNQDNIKLLEEHQKSWNPLKGGIIETTTGRPIADTEIPFRIEKFKKLRELYPQIPEAAGKYQQQRGGITGGLQGGMAGLTLAKILDTILPYNAAKNTKPKKDKKNMDAKTQKKADSTAAIMGGLGGLVPGGVTGAGAGGLYGLVSGAYQAEKGKKLRGALTGLGRGLVGGGLIGGGIGAGAGAGAGAMLPHGLFSPFGAIGGGLQVAADPIGTASRSALGGVAGAALGGYLGNKARKSTLGEPKKEEKSEEKNEKEDNKSEEKEERKAAGYKAADLTGLGAGALTMGGLGGLVGMPLGGVYGLASGAYQAGKGKRLSGAMRGLGRGVVGGGYLGHKTYKKTVGPFNKDKEKKEAELKLAPLDGMKQPNNNKGTSLNQVLEEARKKREENEKKMPVQKAANDWKGFDYSNVGPGGLIRSRTLPQSNGMGGAKTWGAANQTATPAPQPQPQLPMRAVAPAMKSIPQTPEAARAATPPAPAPAAAQPTRFASPLTLERVLPGQGLAPFRKSVENATGGFFGDGPQLQKGGSAYAFGKTVKRAYGFNDFTKQVSDTWNSPTVQGFVNDPTTRAGLTYGGIGAGLGGLYGLVNPGEYEDAEGNVHRRGRLSGALRGALGGGAIGGLAGAGAQEGRFQYLKHLMNQRAGFPNAMGGLDRGEAQENAEAFARNNPSVVGALGTSPLQSANNAYSAASDAVKGWMPKRMGKAPATGVETPVKPPEVKPAN